MYLELEGKLLCSHCDFKITVEVELSLFPKYDADGYHDGTELVLEPKTLPEKWKSRGNSYYCGDCAWRLS